MLRKKKTKPFSPHHLLFFPSPLPSFPLEIAFDIIKTRPSTSPTSPGYFALLLPQPAPTPSPSTSIQHSHQIFNDFTPFAFCCVCLAKTQPWTDTTLHFLRASFQATSQAPALSTSTTRVFYETALGFSMYFPNSLIYLEPTSSISIP